MAWAWAANGFASGRRPLCALVALEEGAGLPAAAAAAWAGRALPGRCRLSAASVDQRLADAVGGSVQDWKAESRHHSPTQHWA